MAIKGKCTECPGNIALLSVFDLGVRKRTPLMRLQLKRSPIFRSLGL